MTREEAIRCLNIYSSTNGSGRCTDKQHYEAKQMAIKALEREPCDDAVSRQAAIDGLNSINGTSELDKAFEVIENLPSVLPKQKRGHWLPTSFIDRTYECDICHNYVYDKTKYCPNCGCKMEG